MDVFNISIYVSQLSVAVPIYFFLAKKSNLKNQDLRTLGILLGVSVLFDIIGYVSAILYNSNNIINNIFTVFEFLLLCRMYWGFYKEGHETDRKIIKISVIIFLSAFLTDTIVNGLFEAQNISLGVSGAALIFIAYRFYRILQNLPTIITKKLTAGRDVYFKTFYFINVAVFLYFVLNLWLFTLNPIVLEIFNEEADFNIWTIHNVMNIVKNCLFAIGLYWAGKKELE